MSHRRKQNRRGKERINPFANCPLPQKALTSILSRLPVKSLVRFKEVCKPWQNLVTDPEFIKLHYNNFCTVPKKTFIQKSQSINSRNIGMYPTKPYDPTKPENIFLASCRGLMCIGRPSVTDRVLLWNPATRLWKTLPPPVGNYGRNIAIVSLGFGCNEEGDDHKVVRMYCMLGKKMKVHSEVYSTKSDSWKVVKPGFHFSVATLGHHTLVDGNPYWIAVDETNEFIFVRFDATRMSYDIVPMPSVLEQTKAHFMGWDGHLAALACYLRDEGYVELMDLYLYKGGEIGWDLVKRSWIEGKGLRGLGCVIYSSTQKKLVGRVQEGNLFEIDNITKNVTEFGEIKAKRGMLQVFGHEESLAYVKGMTPMDLVTDVVIAGEPIDCIVEGFVTAVNDPTGTRSLEIYYNMAF